MNRYYINRVLAIAVAVALGLMGGRAEAATYYWDTDGSTAGFGDTAGTWGTQAFWSTDPNGTSATALTGITTADGINFGTASLTLGSTAAALGVSGAVSVNSITFGAAQATAVTLSGGTSITLGGTTPTITVNNAADTISSILAGTAGLTKNGAGTLTLTGANTVSGTTTISAGTLKLQGANMWKTARTYTINGGAVLHLDGGLEFGTGTAAATTINGNGTLRLNGWFGKSSGTGVTITMSLGAGALIDIQSGATLQNGGWSPITWSGNSGNLNVDGTFNYVDGLAVTVGALTGGGTITKTYLADTKTLTVGTANASGVFSGVIQNPTGVIALTKTGTGTQTLSGNNSYSGTTTVSAGVLNIQHANALGTTAGSTTVASGAALTIQNGIAVGAEPLNSLNGTGLSNGGALRNISGNNSYAGLITLAGATRINSDAGLLTLDVASGNAITGTQNLTLGGAGNITVADNINISTGTLTKDGGGTLTLSGTSTYTGATTVYASTLALGHATDTLANTGAVIVDGATAILSIAGNSDTVGAVSLKNGAQITGSGGTLTGSSYAVESGSVSAILGGSGALTKSTTGTVTLSGANSYTGATTVNGGTLLLDKTGTGALASTSALTLGGGTFSIKGKTSGTTAQTMGALTLNAGTSIITLDPNNGTGTTLTLGDAWTCNAGASLLIDYSSSNTGTRQVVTANATTGYTLNNGIYGAILVKDSSGVGFATRAAGSNQAITRYDDATGTTLVDNSDSATVNYTTLNTVYTAGVLNWNNGITTRSVNSLTFDTTNNGGTINMGVAGNILTLTSLGIFFKGANDGTLTGGQVGAANSEVYIHQTGSGVLTINSLISSGTGRLTKYGTGTLVLTGNNAYAGATTINAGTLKLQGVAFYSTARNYSISSGAVLNFDGVDVLNKAITINGSGTFRISGGVFRNNNTGGDITWSLGAGGLIDIQSGAHVQTYYSFGDLWTGNQATLNVDGQFYGNTGMTINTAALTGAGTIDNSGTTLNIGANNGSGTFSGAIRNTTSLTKNGTGTQTLSGNNTYAGVTTVSANGGTLQFAKANSLLSSNWTKTKVTVNSGGTIAFSVGGTDEFTTGNVTTLLTGLGGTVSGNGLLAGSTIAFDITNASGGTFTIADTVANTSSGAVGLKKLGTNTLVLSGPNSYGGATTISAGTLLINGNQSTANGAVAVAGTSTLGGSGTVGGPVTVAATAKLAPGNSAVGTLTLTGNLTFTVASGDVGALDFQLDASDASDKIVVGGTLDIGTAALGLSDFNFTNLGGLGDGTYTLIQTSSTITGTLASGDTNGTFEGATIVLQKSGDGTDLELVVSGLAAAPEIAVDQGGNINTGGSKGFGTLLIGSPTTLDFTINNLGTAALDLNGTPRVAVSGDADFTVTAQPAASVAAGGNTTFTVQFSPVAPGARNAQLSIANNDASGSENPFIINLSGTGQTTTLWDGDTSVTWSDPANWAGGSAPANSLTTDIAHFNLASTTFAPNAGTTSIKGITIGASNGAMTLTTTNLSIGDSGLSIANGAGALNANGTVTIGAAQTWTHNDNDAATFGVIDLSNKLTLAGGNFLFTGVNTGTGSIDLNAGTLEISSTGKLYGTSTATAVVTVGTGATLRAKGWGFDVAGGLGQLAEDAGRLVVNGGTIEYAGTTMSGSQNFTVGDSGATLKTTTAGQTWTFNTLAQTTIANNSILTVGGAGNGAIEKIIAGAGTLTKTDGGTWTLSGNNTYIGITTINAGTLRMQGMNPMNGAARTYSISSGAVLNFDGVDVLNKAITINGSGTFRISGGVFRNNNTGGDITWSLGAGGLIDIQSGAHVQTYYSFGDLWTGNQATLNVDGQFYGNTGMTINTAALTGAGTIDNSGTTLNIGANNGSGTFSGAIRNTTSLTKNGTGTQTLSGPNDYSGNTTVSANGGTLQFAKANSLLSTSWTKTKVTVNSGGTIAFNVGGTDEFTTGNVTTLLTGLGGLVSNNGLLLGSAIAFDTTNASGGTFTIDDTIANTTGTGGGNVGLKKLGTNTLVLSGPNSYGGATTISAGTLLINGNQSTANGAVAVDGTSTLGGSGTVGGPVTVAATAKLAPGNSAVSVGTLNLTGNLTFAVASGDVGALDFQLDASGASDKIVVGGTLDIGTAALGLGDFNFTNVGGLGDGTYTLIQTSSTITGTLASGDTNGTFEGATIVLQKSGDGTDLELVVSGLAAAPEIAVDQGGNINTGGSKNFGTVFIGSPTTLDFTINNIGTADLNLTGTPRVAVSGDADFTVTAQPAAPVAAGGNTTFTVQFSPVAPGARNAQLSIANNDASGSEDPFIINLSGTGQTATVWDGDTSAAWANGANWAGGSAPANSLTTDIANFNLATYGGVPVYAPDAGTTSIKGITIGAGNGAMTLTTTNLSIGASGIAIANGAGALSVNGTVTIGAAQTWTHNDNDAATFGVIDLSNKLTLAGGNFLFTGVNTGTGSIDLNAGTLEISSTGKLYGVSTATAVVTVGSGATLRANGWGLGAAGGLGQLAEDAGRLVVNGGTIEYAGTTMSGSQNFTVGAGGATLKTTTAGQTWTFNTPAQTINNNSSLTVGGAGNGAIEKIIAGAGTLTKTDGGTWTLSGNNTYIGTTTINAGTLKLQGAGMWNTARTYTISGGAVLNLDGGVNFGSVSPTTTINGTGTLLLTNGYYRKDNDSGGKITMSLSAGALIDIQNDAILQNGGWSYITWSGNQASMKVDGTFNLADGAAVTVDALTGAGSITKGWGAGTTLTVGNSNGSGTFSGTIANPAGTIALTKTGTGTQTLSGANAYSGGTTISGGTLQVGNGGASGTLGSGNVTISAAGAILAFNRSDTHTVTNAVSGTGQVRQVGTGTTELTAVNVYNGATTVSTGTLAGVTGGSCANSDVTVGANAALGVRVDNNTEQWTCKSVTVGAGAGAKLKFAFDVTPSTGTAPLRITGNLTFTGTPTVEVNPANVPPGTCPLLVAGGTAPTAVPPLSGVLGSLYWGGSGNKTLFLNRAVDHTVIMFR